MTPHVPGTLSTTFRIFVFRTFYMGFPSNLLTELLSGSEGAYSSLVGIQTAQYTPPSSFLQKYAFWRFLIFQNQEISRKTSRNGPYTLMRSLGGPSRTLVDMETAQDTLVSTFLVTDVRHASVSVRILLEWEISRKSSGKPHFTAVLGVTIQSRTLWWISILFRHPGSRIPSREVRSVSRRCQPVLCRARSTTPGAPHPPLTYSVDRYSDCWDNRLNK